MITSHIWRPTHVGGNAAADMAKQAQCGFMNCGRPRAEHAQAVSPRAKARAR